jgi:malate synthase
MQARHQLHDRVAHRQGQYDFLDGSTPVADADGNRATVADIRQGMLDGFFGRKSPKAWKVAASVPIPKGHDEAGTRRNRTINRSRHGVWRAQQRRFAVDVGLGGRWRRLQGAALRSVEQPEEHSCARMGRKGVRTPDEEADLQIEAPKQRSGPTIFHRVAGLHLRNRQIFVDGQEVPRSFPGLVIHALNNYETQKKNGSGIYYYIPKLESWQEAELVGTLLKSLEEAMGHPARHDQDQDAERARRVRPAAGSDRVGARENLIGPNVGRWDYINSREDMFHHDPVDGVPEPLVR